jgi:hypothetical protein
MDGASGLWKSCPALRWYHPGRLVPIRYVMVRDVAGELRPHAFLCTDLKADSVDIVRWLVRRWSIEVTFAEVRRHLRLEPPLGIQSRSPRSATHSPWFAANCGRDRVSTSPKTNAD